jgi:hypothetical protein
MKYLHEYQSFSLLFSEKINSSKKITKKKINHKSPVKTIVQNSSIRLLGSLFWFLNIWCMIEQFYLFEYMVLSLIPPLLIKMPVRSQENDRSSIYVLGL